MFLRRYIVNGDDLRVQFFPDYSCRRGKMPALRKILIPENRIVVPEDRTIDTINVGNFDAPGPLMTADHLDRILKSRARKIDYVVRIEFAVFCRLEGKLDNFIVGERFVEWWIIPGNFLHCGHNKRSYRLFTRRISQAKRHGSWRSHNVAKALIHVHKYL